MKFTSRVVQLINNTQNGFISQDHKFITPFKNVYNAISNYPNVVLYEIDKPMSAKFINEIAQFGDWLIVHNMCKPFEVRKIEKVNLAKIIWRTWGSDVGYVYQEGEIIKNTIKYFLNALTKKYYRSIYAVGYANLVDVIDVEEKFGKKRMFRLSYAGNDFYRSLCKILESNDVSSDGTIRIMIGHYGHKDDNHFAVIDQVKKYKNENVKFCFPISYGDASYISKLKIYAQQQLGDKVEFWEQFIPFQEYAEKINQMDICIMNGTRSYALGNISLALFFKKKVFLNRNGVIKKAFEVKNVPFGYVDEIEHMDFETFALNEGYSEECIVEFIQNLSPEKVIEGWHSMLQQLEKESQRRKKPLNRENLDGSH